MLKQKFPAGFDCKDTGYALSLLGATGLCGLILIPGFMSKNLTWVSFNTLTFASLKTFTDHCKCRSIRSARYGDFGCILEN
jgi:hypothetical protein